MSPDPSSESRRSTPDADGPTTAAAPERRPLPQTADDLAPLGAEFEAAVRDAAAVLGVSLDPRQLAALEVHARLLLAWNGAINLTAIRDPLSVARLHVADSLAAVPILRSLRPPPSSLLDLGSGGGYPGVPLGVALRLSRVGLLDSVAKKVRFLDVAARAVREALGEGAPRIDALRARAEELARTGDGRERWDVVTVRAVGTLEDIAELALPLLRRGGTLLAWKRDPDGAGGVNLRREVDAARTLISAAGGASPQLTEPAPDLLPAHVLVSVRKTAASPARYPRDPAQRQRPRMTTRRP